MAKTEEERDRPGEERGRATAERDRPQSPATPEAREIGGPKGPEPTRYGDWEKGGRCTDF